MMKELQLCIVGTNFISDQLVRAAQMCHGVAVSAVCSRTQMSAYAFAARYGIPHTYTDMDAMLSDASIDAVYIATPNMCHFDMAERALTAGKHVLCEKPITQNAAQTEQLIALARSRSLVLLEAMRPDFDPAYDALRAALPRIGRLRRAELRFCQYSSRYDAFRRGEVLRAFDPSIGNCALADIGIYPLHLAISLFGEPQRIASCSTFLSGGFEGSGDAVLCYPSQGCTVSIHYSKISQGVTPSVLEGEEGSITIDKLTSPSQLHLYERNGTRVTIFEQNISNNMTFELDAFCAMVRGERSEVPYQNVALSTMRAYDTIVRQNGIFPS